MGSLVLLTGATGYLGFMILLEALKAGYHVRAAVRSIEKAKKQILEVPSLSSAAYTDNITFVEVPDILAPKAYDEAVKGVDYIIHVASPLPGKTAGDDFEKELIEPARNGTLGILRSASTEPSIKRVIITSSVVANGYLREPTGRADAHTRRSSPKGPFTDPWQAYAASKIVALNSTEEFITEHKPKFDTISIMPGYIIGPNLQARTRAEFLVGTAAAPIQAYVNEPRPFPNGFVNVKDAAYVHVAALDKKIQGNRAYGVSSPLDWNDAWSVLEKDFSEAVQKGVFVKRDRQTIPLNWDASETQRVFGFKFKTLEESTVEVAQAWLQLKDTTSEV